MDAGRQRALGSLVLVLDAVVVAASMWLALTTHRALRPVVPFLKEVASFHAAVTLAYVALPEWLGLAAILGLHRIYERPWSRSRLLVDLLKLHFVGFLTLTLVLFVTQLVINRSLIALFLLGSFTLMYVERAVLHGIARWQHAQGIAQPRILLVGAPSAEVDAYATEVTARPLGPAVERMTEPTVEELERVLHERPIDAVLFFPPFATAADEPELLKVCETVGVAAHFAIDLPRPEQAMPRVVSVYDRPFVTFEVAPKAPIALAIKHAFDLVGSLCLLVATSPILAVAALAILVTMGRPVFFVQERAGLQGRRFRMFKLRTMVQNAEARREELASRNEMSGPVFKVTDDPRVTPLGRFLRKTSIDELPQLLNVLLGDMSLVGPRPLPVGEQQRIRGWHRRRLSMKPGVTCLWQIGGRNQLDFEDWMKLDLAYIDGWSLGLDLVILLKTVPAVLLRRGAS